jgi:hypothetical protein
VRRTIFSTPVPVNRPRATFVSSTRVDVPCRAFVITCHEISV